jgi:hypothetical protein
MSTKCHRSVIMAGMVGKVNIIFASGAFLWMLYTQILSMCGGGEVEVVKN